MNHTFLVQEGTWVGTGFYIDADNQSIPCKGKIRTTHREKAWLHESAVELSLKDNTIEIHSSIDIVPFKENRDHTNWTSNNPDLGMLLGEFVIVDDSIISTCLSKSGKFKGSEYFLKLDDTTYKNRGILTKQGGKLSSWFIELHKTE